MHILTFNLVVALPAEARPLINHFGLRRQQPDGAFPIYRNEQVSLVLSGVGKQASAAATRCLFEGNDLATGSIWINIGIAGHACRPVGDIILANNVVDETTGQHWMPQLGFVPPCDLDMLTTLNQPDNDYARPGAFDMEAAGFLAAAGQKAYCLKIISDNKNNQSRGIKGKVVSQLVMAQLGILDRFIKQLSHSE
ncbi:hypothetical protein MNBD_GAMMA26-1296 [hydrothermal vent metagenome]|uniref:Nucleoside phosphorylase domain-containing protein n=1 Tax=hydrothermal vent metagenome TaxID=652676 RepID=A0A3B1BUU3_9ZZZZ